MKIIKVEKTEQLKELVDAWAMTWEGLAEESFEKALDVCCEQGKDGVGYVMKGKTMNAICKLSGCNAYPDDLTIFAIKDFKGLAIQFGARWMWDIVANNGRREGYLPFSLE